METEAEIPEPIPSNKSGEKDKEPICGESESSKELQKVEGGLDLHAKIVENLTKTEDPEVVTNVNDIVGCVVESDGICEGESFLVSPSLAKVAIENTCIASESTVVDENLILQQKEIQKDLKQEAVLEANGTTEAENFNAFVKQVPQDPGLKSDEKPAKLPELPSEKNVEETGLQKGETEQSPLNTDEGNETQKKEVILGQEVETMDRQASTRELSHNIEEVKAVNHSQEDEIEGKKSRKESELEFREQINETSKGTTDQNQEALPFAPDLIGEVSKIDVRDIREACTKDASRDDAPIKQEVEESGFEGVRCKGQEKSSNTEDKGTGPTIVYPSEKIWEKKQEGQENPQDNNTDSALKGEESSKIQDSEEIINNSDGTNEKFHSPPTKFITDKTEQESGNIEQSSSIALEDRSKETKDSNETLKDVNPNENENPDDDLEIALVAEETRLDKSEQEAGKLEEAFSSELEEKSQETTDSNEKKKDETPVEYELPGTEDLEIPLVTQEAEGSHFQEQEKPEKIEEISETESVNIGKDNCSEAKPQDKIVETAESTIREEVKDDENPETKHDTSSITDEEGLEGLQTGSEKLVLPLTNASTDKNKNIGGSSVAETRDNTEVTEIIGAEENCRWQMPKDVEASEQSLQTDKPEEENLERSFSESVEPAASSADAERSTCEKEEESINSVEVSFKEERKEGNINWDDKAREQRTLKDENLRAFTPSQKIENMEVECPNMELGNSPVTHSLVEETIKQVCEQQGEVSNLEVEEQVHEENRNSPVENKHIEEAFRVDENMESTMLEQEKTKDGAQTLELIPKASEMEVEETAKVCELDSKDKSVDTDASQKIEEQNEKNEASEIGMSETVTGGEVEKMIIMEDCRIPDQGTEFLGNKTDNQASQVEEKKEAPEFSGEEQSCKTNDTDNATKNEIINKEVSAEPKIAGVGEETEKHIIEESTNMAHSTESMNEPLRKSSQEDEIMKKHEEEIHKGPHTECEVLETSSTGENTEIQTVIEDNAVKDHSSPPIQKETATESSQEDEVFGRPETTGVGGETERSISEEYVAVTDTYTSSVVGTTVKGSFEGDEKEEEKLKEFTDSEAGTTKNMEDTNKITDASGVTEESREKMLQKEHSNQYAVYEEQSKEDLEKAKDNKEKLGAESARTLQEAEQERKLQEATELTKLGENSRTETLKDECKLQEGPEEGELDGEKPFNAVSKGVETSSSCESIEKDVLDKEDHVKNLDGIPEEGRIGGEEVENMGIKLEAGDSHEINEGFDPRESRALQENTEDVDPSQKLKKACEVVAEDQSQETLPEVKENKVEEDNRVVEDQNTASLEEQMIMQRLQEAEKDSMNLEDIRHKLGAELPTGKEDIPNETTKTAILNEMVHCGHDKVETSQNISKWSIEEESTAKDLHMISIEDGTVNKVQESVLLPNETCTQDDEASPITKALEGDITPRQASEDFLYISKSVHEVSEETKKVYIFKEAETSNDELSSASFIAITEKMSSQENEPESGKLVGASDIGSEEMFQRTFETGSTDEEVKEVKLAQTSDSAIQLPSEGENAHTESKRMEKIDPYEVEEVKRSSNAVSASEYQAVKAITEAETTASRLAMVEESEENLHGSSVSGSEQELGKKTTNQKIRDEMLEEDEPFGVNNSVGPFTLEETENMCLQRNEPKELEQASKMGFQDIEKGNPNEEQKEKGQKLDENSRLDSEIPTFVAKDDESILERDKASNVCRIETSKEEKNENSVSESQKEESESKRLEIPFNKMSGEHDEDGEKVNTEKDLLEKDQHVKSPKETLEQGANGFDTKEKAEISHFISEEQEKETPPSMDKVHTSKIEDETDKDLDASPAPNSPAVEATKEQAVNEPQEVIQLVPKELIHGINETNKENREGAAEDKNVVKELIEVQKPNNTSSNLVSNPCDIVEDLHPTDQEFPINDSNTSSFAEASQEQAPEKGSQMTEDEEGLTLEFTKQATGEVNLPKEAMEGDPVIDEGAVKESSNKESEKTNNDEYFHESNANEGGETPIPGQENMAVLSSDEQAAAEKSFKDNTEKHDRTTNVVIEEQDLYLPSVGEETVKNVCQDEMEEKVDEIATKLKDEDKSQALGAIEDQGEKINPADTPYHEILNEDVSKELDKANASANWGEQIKEETRMAKNSFLVAMGETTHKESHHEDENERNNVNDTKIKLGLEDESQEFDAEEDLKGKANEASKIMKCETLHEEVSNGIEDDGSSDKMKRQVTEEEAMKDPSLASSKEETVKEDHEGENKDSQEVKSSDVVSVEQQLEKTPSTEEADTSTIKCEADKGIAALPATNSPAAEEEAVNEPREVTQPVPKELIHGINETRAENIEGAAEDKNVVKKLIDVQKPDNTSSIFVSNPGDNVEDLHPSDQEVPTNDSNASSFTEASEQASEKGSQMTEDEEGQTFEFTKPATGEVNLPKEAMEGDSVKDEGAEIETSNKEGEKMDMYTFAHGTNEGETQLPGQENMEVFSSVEQAASERSFKDNPEKHDTMTNLVIEEQIQVENHHPQHVDEISTKLEFEDKNQATIRDQEEKAKAANECEILNEDVSRGLDNAGASATKGKEIMEETGMVTDPCPASIGEETYKECQQEDEKEGNKVNDIKTKLEVEDQSQELDAEEDIKNKENEANMTTKCGTLHEKVSNGFENAGSSERIERQMTEEEDLYLVPIKEETVSEGHEEERDSQKVEKEETKLNPRDQNHETNSKDDATEKSSINKEVKSSDVVLEEEQLETTPSTNEADATTIKDEADKDLDASPTPNSPAEEAPEDEAVNEPKEAQLMPKEPIHEIDETNEENKEGAAEYKNAVKELNKVQNPNNTSSNLESNPGDTVEDMHPNDQEVQPNSSNISSLTESSQEQIPEKEGHVTEDEERNNLVILKQTTSEVNLPTEKTEGDSTKDEDQAQDTLSKECEKMNDHTNVQETTCGYEEGETPPQEQGNTVVFSSVEQATAEQRIRDSPKDHDTTNDLVIEKKSLVKDPYEECVGEETVKKAHQDKKEGKRVDEIATELEAKDKIQAPETTEDQMEQIIETNDTPKCEILSEEVPEELEKVDTTENIEKQNFEENRTVKNPCEVSIGEEACKESHHEEKKEGKSVNGIEIKLHLEDQSQEELAGEDLGDIANESNKTAIRETLSNEVSLGTENPGSSEKIEKKIIEEEAIKDSFLAAIEEETTKKAHREEEKDGLEVEKEAHNLDPKDQNQETSSQNDTTENHILDEKVESSHFVPVEQELETTVSTDKMDIMPIKEDLDVPSTPNTPDKEAPVGEAVYEPQEATPHEPKELIHESIIMNEENTESATEDKTVAKEFIEVGKLNITSSDLVSNPSNIVEDLHPKDQELPTNKSNASSLTEPLQVKTPEKEGNLTEDEESNSWVFIKQEEGETSLATGEMEVYSINNEAPVQEILNKEAEEMNNTGADGATRGGETPVPKWQERAIFSSTEQAIAESSIRDSREVPDTTGNLVFEEQSHVQTTEKTKGQKLEDADTLNEKLSPSDVQPSDRELPQKMKSVMLPEVNEISQNIGKLERAADATTEDSTQTKIQTAEKDIPSLPQHSIAKSEQGDEVEDQRTGEALGTESKEKGVEDQRPAEALGTESKEKGVEDQRPAEALGTESKEKRVEYSGDSTMGDAKPMHKKSHNILSGVGSKVKHSIANLKKVMACTHPIPDSEPSSPK